jgi:hypothetical protein
LLCFDRLSSPPQEFAVVVQHGRLRAKFDVRIPQNTIGEVTGSTADGKIQVSVTVLVDKNPKKITVDAAANTLEPEKKKDRTTLDTTLYAKVTPACHSISMVVSRSAHIRLNQQPRFLSNCLGAAMPFFAHSFL